MAAMLRKAAFLAMVPILLASTDATPLASTFSITACRGADLSKAMAPIRLLFSGHPETRAVLVTADGCPAFKAYAPGYSDTNRFISWSMAKTVTGMLVGALVTDGRLKLDAPAPIAEWHRPGDPRGAITLRHLLQMSSGLQHIEVGDPVEKSDTNQTLFVSHTGAMAAAAIDHPLETKPGTTFRYSSLTTIILAEIVARTLTDSRDPRTRAALYTEFAQARLFRPAGITSAVLEYDGAGTQIGGSILHMSLDDWGRIGGLLLDGKAGDGRQVIDPAWLTFMKAPSPTNAEYGAQTWLNRPGGAEGKATLFPGKGPASAVAADGHLGQLVIASPDSGPGRGIVVVRLGNTPDARNAALMQTLGDVVAGFDRPAAKP
ncbi:Beta-lactamase class C and other penicillin binding proteins [hydrothermal vent metagenome]|uniref:Beta-lactamase class C and other penicillin binding proteins n=1 Tax=hydrothermal vent metagenome TaxID=652676 RepID=A0A170PPN1_9ZZZZ